MEENHSCYNMCEGKGMQKIKVKTDCKTENYCTESKEQNTKMHMQNPTSQTPKKVFEINTYQLNN